jgi:hypothetical protein
MIATCERSLRSKTPRRWASWLPIYASRPNATGVRVRPLNPHAPGDGTLLDAISRGELTINGFNNHDLRVLLFHDEAASKQHQHRHAAAVSRTPALLHAHRLIKQVPGTHRYHLTAQGRLAVTALIIARNANANALTKLAA